MIDKRIKEQVIAIRNTGRTNMFDIPVVQLIAFEMDFYELVIFIEKHPEDYVRFILKGE